MPYIKITVRDKVATGDRSRIVCGNSDYIAIFDFDAEWDPYDTKTARFVYAEHSGQYVDVVFTGTECPVPVIQDVIGVTVGVFAGDLHTTTPAWFECDKSILCGGGSPAAPPDDVYNQIMELIHGLGTLDEKTIAAAVADYILAHPIQESDPTVPDWAKEGTKPSYTAAEVGADPSGTAASQVSAHNTGTDTHSDIRLLIQGLTERLNSLADSDDTTLDQLSEIVAYIKSNRDLISAVTTDKVSVSDIVDNLTTNVATAPLSAAQGVALKALIDATGIEMEKTDLNIDWSFADGMPQDKGLTYTGTEGKAVMQSDGLLLSAGAAYQPPVLAAGKASVECVFSSPNFGNYYGFRLQLTNGTTGIRISCYSNSLIYNQGTDNNLTLATLTTGTEYTLRIAWDEESGAKVYLNGEAVLTGGRTSYALAENLVSQVSGGGTILLKSLAYTFPGMGDEIVSINGKGLRDETARAMAAQGGGGGGLTVTNTATVGQTVKVSAVDENGQPTEWEAVDMASATAVTPELLYSGTAENVTSFQQDIDFKGHRNLVIVVSGTKGDAGISMNEGNLYMDGNRFVFAYYSGFLSAASASAPNGCVVYTICRVGPDRCRVDFSQFFNNDTPFWTYLQASSSTQSSARTCYLKSAASTAYEKISVSFSASVQAVAVEVYGF